MVTRMRHNRLCENVFFTPEKDLADPRTQRTRTNRTNQKPPSRDVLDIRKFCFITGVTSKSTQRTGTNLAGRPQRVIYFLPMGTFGMDHADPIEPYESGGPPLFQSTVRAQN